MVVAVHHRETRPRAISSRLTGTVITNAIDNTMLAMPLRRARQSRAIAVRSRRPELERVPASLHLRVHETRCGEPARELIRIHQNHRVERVRQPEQRSGLPLETSVKFGG